MITFKRATHNLLFNRTEEEKGMWSPSNPVGGRDDGLRSANISCSLCGTIGSLREHQIATDGTISPSIACPNDSCLFHDNGVLEGWNG